MKRGEKMKIVKLEMNKLIERANDGDIFEASHLLFKHVEVDLVFSMKVIENLKNALEVAAVKSEDLLTITHTVRLLDFLNAVEKEAKDKFNFRIEIEQAAREKASKKKRDPKDEVVI